MKKTENDTAAQMAEFLPDALKLAISMYETYALVDKDTKDYKEAQAACKVALGHIAVLVKLKDRVEKDTGKAIDSEHLDALIASAQKELDESRY